MGGDWPGEILRESDMNPLEILLTSESDVR
jgi:hypothetical protein